MENCKGKMPNVLIRNEKAGYQKFQNRIRNPIYTFTFNKRTQCMRYIVNNIS